MSIHFDYMAAKVLPLECSRAADEVSARTLSANDVTCARCLAFIRKHPSVFNRFYREQGDLELCMVVAQEKAKRKAEAAAKTRLKREEKSETKAALNGKRASKQLDIWSKR